MFCNHIGLEVLIKLRIYRRRVKEDVSSDELLYDTNLMAVKRQYLNVSFGHFTFSPDTYKTIPEVSKPRREKRRISTLRQ